MAVPSGLKAAVSKARELLETPEPFRAWLIEQGEKGETVGRPCAAASCPIAEFLMDSVDGCYPSLMLSVGTMEASFGDSVDDAWWEPGDDPALDVKLKPWARLFIRNLDGVAVGYYKEPVQSDWAIEVLDAAIAQAGREG